jgi:hypothetical protein
MEISLKNKEWKEFLFVALVDFCGNYYLFKHKVN